jgi:hypothetical protein
MHRPGTARTPLTTTTCSTASAARIWTGAPERRGHLPFSATPRPARR